MDHSSLVKLFIFLLYFIAIKCQRANQQYFRIKPQDVNANEKETIQLNCEVGNLAGLVQWSKDGFLLGYESQITGYPRYTMIRDLARGSFNLQIKRAQLDFDEGKFECQVGPSENNQPIRAGAIVSINVPPQELSLTSTSPISLPFKNLNSELNLNDPSLTLTSLNISQFISSFNSTSQYTNFIQLINQFINNTDQNKLNKKLFKYRSSLPMIQSRETERLTLVCNTSATKPEAKLIWLRNNVVLKEDQYNTFIKSGLGNSGRLSSTKSSLTIFIKATEEGVIYSCVALHSSQKEPKIMLSVRISVLMPPGTPTIEGYKDNEQITAGDSLNLACIITNAGNPPAQLKWLKDNQILISNSQTIVRQQKKQFKNRKDIIDNEIIEQSTDDFWIDLNNDDETIDLSKLSINRQSDVSRTLSIKVKPEDHFTTYSCKAINQLMFTDHFRSNIASVRLNVQYPPSSIQLVGDHNALISQPNNILKFGCACGPSNPAAQIKLSIDGKPLEIIFKQTEMHYSIDHNSIRTSNSLNLENLLTTFDNLNRKLNGFINFGNSSTSLNKIFIDKQKHFMQRKKQIKVSCTAIHPLLTNTLISEYDLQLLYPPNPPTLKVEPNHSQFAGEYKRFICSASDGNPIAQLKFYEQKQDRINHIPLQSTTNSIGNNNQNSISSTLDLLLTPNENGATIICKIDHPALLTPSFISKQIEVYFFNEQLNLTTETSFKSTNKQQQLNNDEWKLNDEFSLICKTGSCNPSCNLDWYLNNNKLNSASKRFLILNEQSVSSTNGGIITISRLNINSLQISDHDHRIECVQSNSLFNQTTRKDYTIHVLHPPVFDIKNNPTFFDIWENDNETLQLEFIAKGYPNLINYEFYFGSNKLQNSNYFQIQGPKILFKHVSLSFGGQYTIEATNSQGKTSHQFTVNVLYPPKLISSTTLLYLNQNQTVKINCTVSANPISQLKSEWQKLNLFDKFTNQNDDEKLETNDVMYSNTENNESENDENELFKERLAHSYHWNSPNLDWWWSNQHSISSSSSYFSDNTFTNNANSHFQTDYKLFNSLNSSILYNQKVISKNNELFIANDTFTTKGKNQQKYYLATATHTIESFLNDTDYLCLIHFNPNEKTEITRTPNINKQQLEQLSIVTTRIALRQKKRPLLLNCNSLELPVLLNHIKEQVLDYHLSNRNQDQVNQNYNNNKKTINNINNRKSILVAAEPGDRISFYCTAIRGALMLQFSWRDVKHGQLLGAISHTFIQPSIESSWRRSLNSSFNDNHYQQSMPFNKNDLNTHSNYTVKLHFNPKLPELITAELRLEKANLDHFSTQFQCLISNELGSDSRIYELRRKSVPDQVDKVHIRNLNNKLVIQWEPGFDGGFNQQYIVRFSLKNELERAIQSKQFLSTHTDNDLQHPNNVYSHENLNELRRMKALEGNEASEQDDEQNLKEESDKMNSDIQWRTEQNTKTTKYAHNHYNTKKKKNLKRRIQWNGYLLSPTGPLAQIGNEKLVLNETQIEFTDLKPSSEYYVSILSKNRLGLAKRHSIPILIKTPKLETNEDNSDQVKSNLQLGENSLGLIENGFLINGSTKNLTLWLFIIFICFIILVNVTIFSIHKCRKRSAKQLTGSLTTETVRTGSSSTNSTQSTTLSSNLNTPQQQIKNLNINKNLNSNLTEYDENQIETNENQTIKISKNENDEIELDDNTKSKKKDEHCIIKNNNNNNNDDILFKNNVTFALLTNPITNSNYITTTNTLTKSNQIDYLNNKQSNNTTNTNAINNQSTTAALVYAQLRSDNSITNNLIHPNDLIQAKTIDNNDLNSRYGNYATLNTLVNHQLDSNAILNNNLDNYNKNNFKTNSLNLQTRINKLSTDYKDKYIPYYLNENLLTNFETDLNCDNWNNMSNINNTITDFYSTKLISSNSLLASCTPSPSTITYSSIQLPHIITSSSLATNNTLSPLDHLTPSTAFSTTPTLSNQLLDDNQIKLTNYDHYNSPTFTNQQSPLLIQTLTKNHSSNHFLINDYQTDNLQSTATTSYKGNSKKSPNKSHCKMVSFQDNYYK